MENLKITLLYCVAVIAVALFASCSDKDEPLIINPSLDEMNPVHVGFVSTLKYDEAKQCWILSANNQREMYLIYTPLEEYSNWEGRLVKISGQSKLLYKEMQNDETRLYYSLKLETIELDETEYKEGGYCFTPMCENGSRSDSEIIIPQTDGLLYKQGFAIKVYTHLIRNSNGIGADKGIVSDELISMLNSHFESANIQFVNYGSQYIDNSILNSLTDQGRLDFISDKVYSQYLKSNCINIFIPTYDDGNDEGLLGIANGIVGNVVILKSVGRIVVAPHEVGHCLGLYHTHHGSPFAHEGGIPEYANGSNSTTAGDYVCDTPADPGLWDEAYFNQTTGLSLIQDPNGDFYHPDRYNIMSYNSYYDTDRFSQKQIERATYLLLNNRILKSLYYPVPKTISATPVLPQNSGTYSIDVPSGATVTWSIKITNRGNNIPTYSNLTYYGSTITFRNPYPSAEAQKAVFNLTIKMKDGIIYTHSEEFSRGDVEVYDPVIRWSFESSTNGDIIFNGTIDPAKAPDQNNSVKIRQNGELYLDYSGEDGIPSSQQPSKYNYVIENCAFLTPGSKPYSFHVRNAPVNSSGSFLLIITGLNTQKTVSVPYVVRAAGAVNSEEEELMEYEERDSI